MVGSTSPARALSVRSGRVYDVPGVGLVPSVTTVTRKLAAPGLVDWKLEQVARAAWRTTEWRDTDEDTAAEMIVAASRGHGRVAALRGSMVHDLITRIEEEAPKATPEMIGYLTAAAGVIATLGDPFDHEVTLVNPKHRYAGTADLLTWSGEELSVTDWKTTDIGKQTGWREHQLQLVALAACDHRLWPDGRLEPLGASITEIRSVALRPDGTSEVRVCSDPNRFEDIWAVFQGLLAAWWLDKRRPGLTWWEDDSAPVP